MKALGRYALTALVIVAVVVGVLWPFLDGIGRTSLLLAIAIALPVQFATFSLVVPALGDQSRFMVRWGIGVFVRMGVVAAVGLSLPRLEAFDGSVLLLTICGLFFALLLVEPAFFRSKDSAQFAQ